MGGISDIDVTAIQRNDTDLLVVQQGFRDGEFVRDSEGNLVLDSEGNPQPLPNMTQMPVSTFVDPEVQAISDVDSKASQALSLSQEASAKVDTYDTRIIAAESDIDTLEVTSADHESRLVTAESDIDALEVTSADHESRITTAESDIDALEATSADHESRITTAESDIDALEVTSADHESRITTAESDIDALEAELDAPTTAEATMQAAVYELGSDINGADVIPLDGGIKSVISGMTYINEVQNGDFSAGTTWWEYLSSTHSVIDNVLQNTADGSAVYGLEYSTSTINVTAGDKIFFAVKMRVTNSDATRLYLQIADGGSYTYLDLVVDPILNEWYILSGIYTVLNTGTITPRYIHNYIDTATANGKIMEMDGNHGVTSVNLTSINLDTLTLAQCLEIFRYGDNTVSALAQKITTTKKNLFDKHTLEINTYDGTGQPQANPSRCRTSKFIPVKPSTTYVLSKTVAEYWNINEYSTNSFASWIIRSINELSAGNSFTTTASTNFIMFNTDASLSDTLDASVQLELGTTATAYEPYESTEAYLPYEAKRLPNDVADSYEDGKFVKRIETSAITSGTSVDTTNYPLALDGSGFIIFLTAGGSQTGVVGTDSASGDGTLYYQLAEPQITDCPLPPLSGDEKGQYIIEPYIHDTFTADSSGNITLPYEVESIDSVKDIEGNEVDYTLSGTALTITGASEGDVYFVNAPIQSKYSAIPKTTNTYPQNVSAQIQYNTKGIKQLADGVNALADDGDVFEDAIQTNIDDIRELQIADAIKIHRITADTTVVANAWTDCSGFTEVAEETSGDCASLNTDGKTIDIFKDGLYHFGGCLHCQNNTTGLFSGITILSRLYQNGTTEMRCSQRGFVVDMAASGEEVISFTGTALLSAGDTITLQYYTDNSDLNFTSNTNFDSQIAYTLWMVRIGE